MSDKINNGGVGFITTQVDRNIVWDEGYPVVDGVRVGPIDTPNGTSYVYRIGNRLSEPYVNAESARYDARRPQQVNGRGRLEPLA
jgi:hypothetical protein